MHADRERDEPRGWDRFPPLGPAAPSRRVSPWALVCLVLALASAICLTMGLTRDVPGSTGSCPFAFSPLSDRAIEDRQHWWAAALALAVACPLVSFAGAFFNEPPDRYWKCAIALLVLPVTVLVAYPAVVVCPYV